MRVGVQRYALAWRWRITAMFGVQVCQETPLYGTEGPNPASRACSLRGGIEHLTKELPTGAGPALQPHLREVHVNLVARIDAYARQQRRQRYILQARRLPDDVLAGQIVSALLDQMFE